MKWLAVFLIIPSTVFAECEDLKVTDVGVRLQNVSWAGTLEPSCLQSFEVCWTSNHSNSTFCKATAADAKSMLIDDVDPYPIMKSVSVSLPNVSWTGTFETQCLAAFEVCWGHVFGIDASCEMVPPETTSMLINDVQPCQYISVDVSAIGKGNLNRSTKSNAGDSAPPRMSGLRTTQRSRDMTMFEWSSLSNYSCVDNVWLWLCDNATQDRRTCFFAELYSDATQLQIYDFPVCRQYYAFACARHLENCDESALRVYIDSGNELTNAEAVNVTYDSAVMKWWVSDVNFTCRTETMRICYQEKSNGASLECYSWQMDQADSSDSRTLTDLNSCATYSAIVSLRTAVGLSSRTVTFTTPLIGDAINATASNVSDTAALVAWSFDAVRTDCQPDSMQVCYAVAGDDAAWQCRSLGIAAHSSVNLHNLAVCTRYEVSLTLLTTAALKPTTSLQFTTSSTGHPVLESMITTAGSTSVRVEWAPANTSLQCVRFYNVSWYSSGDPRRSWQTVSAGSTSFTIFAASRGQTYYVQVAAVFVDNTAESLFQHVDVPGRSDSPSPFHTTSPLNVLTLVVVFLKNYYWH